VLKLADRFLRNGHARVLRSGQTHGDAVTVLGGPYPGRSPALTELSRRSFAAALAEAGLRPTFPTTQASLWRDMRCDEEAVVILPSAPRPR
jgi:hypothetical protein